MIDQKLLFPRYPQVNCSSQDVSSVGDKDYYRIGSFVFLSMTGQLRVGHFVTLCDKDQPIEYLKIQIPISAKMMLVSPTCDDQGSSCRQSITRSLGSELW